MLAVSFGLALLVAAAMATGGGERRVAVTSAAGDTGSILQVQHRDAAVAPAKRQLGESVSFVLVAVLAGLVGLAASQAATTPWARRRPVLPAVAGRTVRLRGPPLLQFS